MIDRVGVTALTARQRCARAALSILRAAIAEVGQLVPGSTDDMDVKAVPVSEWRRRCYASLCSSSVRNSKVVAFMRARATLLEAGLIVIDGDHVRLRDGEDTERVDPSHLPSEAGGETAGPSAGGGPTAGPAMSDP